MKKLMNLVLVALLLPAFMMTSCKKDETTDIQTEVIAFEVLKDYLVEIDMDLNHVIKNADDQKFVTGAPAAADLDTWLAKYYIIDIRKADDFTTLGHIEGAHNVVFTDILTAAEAADKQILVVCYTGQTACYATSLLRLAGYHNAQALKWGMSGWNATFAGSWNNNCSNIAAENEKWSYASAPENVKYEMPTLTLDAIVGTDILKARIEAVVAEGFKTVAGGDVLGNPTDYFVNNYFSEADYSAFGHIEGAHRINPLLLGDESVFNLDPLKKVVTYCYTGQTSAVITAYLKVLGYDAYSMTFGVNGLYNSNTAWSSNQWGGDSNPKDLPYVN
ncbi:MAG: rhodanese-like domain-containing protein [Bacteroidales bacterium]|nr:rhodanese-like domain-containing protein [Bacteroidales bacterium]